MTESTAVAELKILLAGMKTSIANMIATALGLVITVSPTTPTNTQDGMVWIKPTDATAPVIGPQGPSNVLTVRTVTTGLPGSSVAFTLTGASPAQIVDVAIPQGATGAPCSLTAATPTTLAPGSSVTVGISGSAPNQVISFGIPQGAPGNTIVSVVAAPTSAQGNNGDYALDYVHLMIYGPKSGGAWPSGVNLVTSSTGGSNLTQYPAYFSDFLGVYSGAYAPWSAQTFGSSPAVMSPASGVVTPMHLGVIGFRSGTANPSGIRIATDTHQILIGGGELSEKVVRFESFVDEGYFFGFTDCTGNVDATNGAYIVMTASGVFAGRTASSGTRSTTLSTATASLATWYRFRVAINGNATRVDFYIINCIDGSYLWHDYLTANIPTGSTQQTGDQAVGWSSRTDANTIFMHLDSMLLEFGPLTR